MRLSSNTIEILQNFHTINQGIVFKPGNVLRTISSSSSIIAEAKIEESFDREFGIYDLSKLLSLLSLNKKNPEISVGEDALSVSGLDGRGNIKLRYTSPKMIVTPPTKNVNGKFIVRFEITKEIFDWIFKVANILSCPHIVFRGEAGKRGIGLFAMDVKGGVDDANTLIDEVSPITFQAVLKIDDIKVIPGEYTVEMCFSGVGKEKRGATKFSHKTRDLVYYVGIEATSSRFEQ